MKIPISLLYLRIICLSNKGCQSQQFSVKYYKYEPHFVIPAKAGIQIILRLDSHFRGNDRLR